MEINSFTDLNLGQPLIMALEKLGHNTPTPIQKAAIPSVLAGKDLLGHAQTGTGKTGAFALPILQRLLDDPRPLARRYIKNLVLVPTRELAVQVHQSFVSYGQFIPRFKCEVVYGGVSQVPQAKALTQGEGTSVLVATPGRLIDLMGQGLIKLDLVETFILDEADRMLDMGFINDINRVIQRLPLKRQNLMFSATMALDVAKVANKLLIRPVTVEVSPNSSTAEKIDQSVIYVEREFKRPILKEMLLEGESFKRVIVFSKTKHGASKVAEYLNKSGIPCEAFHGNKSQSARQNALNNFRNSKTRVLVATDIAARGIDIENITHVINFDIPIDPENYVHRIGRTARAGKSGQAISLCGPEERAILRRIERLIQRTIPQWALKK